MAKDGRLTVQEGRYSLNGGGHEAPSAKTY